jgi:hypothetical protein
MPRQSAVEWRPTIKFACDTCVRSKSKHDWRVQGIEGIDSRSIPRSELSGMAWQRFMSCCAARAHAQITLAAMSELGASLVSASSLKKPLYQRWPLSTANSFLFSMVTAGTHLCEVTGLQQMPGFCAGNDERLPKSPGYGTVPPATGCCQARPRCAM